MKTLLRTDKNGTKYYEEECNCWKCGGTGIYYWGNVVNGQPSYSGVCYACDGTGVVIGHSKEYTPEHQAKLDAARAKREAKRDAERQAKEAERQAKADALAKKIAEEKAKSNYVGRPGDKIEAVVTVAFMSSYDVLSFRGYGMSTVFVYGLKDEHDNLMIWKTQSGSLSYEHERWNKDHTKSIFETVYVHKGDKVRIKASIKEHAEYKEQKQTILTRVKVVEIIEKAEEG